MKVRGGVASRLLHVNAKPVLVRAWQLRSGEVRLRAQSVDPDLVWAPALREADVGGGVAGRPELRLAVERMRFALAVDVDVTDFKRQFRTDPLLAPLIHRHPLFRPRRRPWPWEALAWAVTKQLIEAVRAAQIQRRIVGRWGPRLGNGTDALRDVPCADAISGRAPAELESMDLAGRRAVALRAVAKAVAAGRCDLYDADADRRLTSLPNIGPWTVQCLGYFGRGDLDCLPAGDLGFIKLVGRLMGMDRRATIEEVEAFYAPYEPYRGLAGYLTLAGLHHTVAQGPPQRLAPERELAA